MHDDAGVKSRFALYFGNRGFFPASLMKGAREELPRRLKELGHDSIMMEESATRFGAVETAEEGRRYARWLDDNRGRFDGIILSLPNFGDECGAAEALKHAGVPILVHAYPDDMDRMAPELRRDAFCGKFSIMDVFCQYGIKFTALKPHTVAPASPRFADNVDYFDRVCRVVNGLKDMVVGAIGARTTPFKTVRIDELALQKYGITVETLDLSSVIRRVNDMKPEGDAYERKKQRLSAVTDWSGVPSKAQENLYKLGAVLDEIIAEYGMDALSLRCWTEFQEQLGISPCILLGEMNERMTAAACEVDVGNAVAMHALKLAGGAPPMCLDWNNNYGDDDDRCIVFHCGPIAFSQMQQRGRIGEHAILANAVGDQCSFGCNEGRIKPMDMTFSSLATVDGELHSYLGQGEITGDPVPEDFFGCAGVARIDRLQDVLLHVGLNGHRHHVSAVSGHCQAPLCEALTRYMGWQVALPQV